MKRDQHHLFQWLIPLADWRQPLPLNPNRSNSRLASANAHCSKRWNIEMNTVPDCDARVLSPIITQQKSNNKNLQKVTPAHLYDKNSRTQVTKLSQPQTISSQHIYGVVILQRDCCARQHACASVRHCAASSARAGSTKKQGEPLLKSNPFANCRLILALSQDSCS